MAEGFAETMNMNRCLHIVRAALPLLLVLWLSAQQGATAAALTEEQKGQAIAALEAVAASPSPETTAALYGMVSRADVSAEEWASAFREFLDKNHFSFALGITWREMMGNDGPGQEPAARAAGAFAAAAFQSVLGTTPPNLQELDTVLQWLEQCTAFAPPLVATIGMGLDAVLRGGPLDSALLGDRSLPSPDAAVQAPGTAAPAPGVSPTPSSAAGLPQAADAAASGTPSAPENAAPVPTADPVETTSPKPVESASGAAALPPAAAAPPAFPPKSGRQPDKDKLKKPDTSPIPAAAFPAPAMQVAITLGYYAGPENIGRWMRLPETTLRTYQASGVWVFDGGALTPPQALSLGSLLSAMPASLTGVSVITMMPLPFSLRSPGLVMPVAPVMPELQRPPVMLPPGAVLPSIPDFTATVARSLGEIIQQRELPRRPELVARRDALLMITGRAGNSMLPAFLEPGVYAGPNDFFPSLMVLWVTGSETALQAAAANMDQGDYGGIYALLLLADLVSCGGDTALVFTTNPAGQVAGSETALRRNFLSPAQAYVTGVAAGGRMFFFDGYEYEIMAQIKAVEYGVAQ
jgi:hypothetical protein